TGRVYDHARPLPLGEETPRSLYWGEYAKHKIEGEDAVLERHRRRGLPVTIVRPTHVYGPLNTRNNETFFFDRILRGRPVLVPGAGGGLRPRYTLGAGLAQTWEWYRKEGLDHRPVDFATEDALLALIRS